MADNEPQAAEIAANDARNGDAGIFATMSCEAAFARIAGECAAEIDRHLAVFLGADDEAGPHKTRVALRRLTTAIDAFAPILRRKPAAEARAEAKDIFRRLGVVRDADVLLAVHAGTQEAAQIERDAADLRAGTREKLRQRRAVTFAPRLLADLADQRLLKGSRRGRLARAAPVSKLAGRALDQAWATVRGHGLAISAMKEAARHEFRKDMKTLRYTAEFFEPLWSRARWAEFHAHLQALQDALGLLNDLANARRRSKVAQTPQETEALSDVDRLWRQLVAAGPFWAE